MPRCGFELIPEAEQVLTLGSRAYCSHGARAPRRLPVVVGTGAVSCMTYSAWLARRARERSGQALGTEDTPSCRSPCRWPRLPATKVRPTYTQGAFEPRLLMIDKTAHQTVVESVGGLEGGNLKMIQGRLDVVGTQGWELGRLSQRGA